MNVFFLPSVCHQRCGLLNPYIKYNSGFIQTFDRCIQDFLGFLFPTCTKRILAISEPQPSFSHHPMISGASLSWVRTPDVTPWILALQWPSKWSVFRCRLHPQSRHGTQGNNLQNRTRKESTKSMTIFPHYYFSLSSVYCLRTAKVLIFSVTWPNPWCSHCLLRHNTFVPHFFFPTVNTESY